MSPTVSFSYQNKPLPSDKNVVPEAFAAHDGLEKLPMNFSADEIREMIKEVVG